MSGINLATAIAKLREVHEPDASPEHMNHEADLFKRVTKDLGDVKRMATERLESSKTPTTKHKAQYNKILDLATQLEDVMAQHVASYD